MNKYLYILLFVAALFTSCDDLFSPANENIRDIDAENDDAGFIQGIILNGYTRIPTNSWSFNDVATDDAVTNDKYNNNYMKMATGQWTANNNPMDQWRNSKAAIQYLNILLAESDKVKWADDETVSRLFNMRMKGEAYGLRALFMYYLLQSHGGWTADGQLLGVPIISEPETPESDFNQPRATFDTCMKQIYADLDKAEELLPLDYEKVSEIPAKYGDITMDDYERVFFYYPRLRMTARIAKGIRAKAALLAASPAYASGTTTTWEDAAKYAGEVINLNGGLSSLASDGWTWYANHSQINNLQAGVNPPEILWRGDSGNSLDLEQDNYPPSIYGRGRINPTQNLVDAFPMANGYPITDLANSGYDKNDPYAGRDPRLEKYIIVNGSKAGPSSSTIYTEENNTIDGLNANESATRTGYYMRKLLREDVNLNPTSQNQQRHYNPRIRYTEIFLIYAEAANEAWGPTNSGSVGFSAYDVVKAIRLRAGVGKDSGDPYLESIKNDKAAMQKLIRNERRLELCFEGFRFWDLRRWEAPINDVAKGVRISGGAYEEISVENRVYRDYMYYGPIPYSEVLKWDALVQNKGWK